MAARLGCRARLAGRPRGDGKCAGCGLGTGIKAPGCTAWTTSISLTVSYKSINWRNDYVELRPRSRRAFFLCRQLADRVVVLSHGHVFTLQSGDYVSSPS